MSKKSPLEENHEEVVRLLGECVSAREIAVRFGVTRNTVIGYCTRRKLKMQAPTGRRAETSAARKGKPLDKPRKAPDRPVPARKPDVPLPPPLPATAYPVPLGGVGVPFLDMGREQCRRPLWGLQDRIGNVCGLPVPDWPEYAYCRGCMGLLFSEHGRIQFRRNVRGRAG